ncbi:MAG: dTDP-4-dehydrorhamnose 3,5-epimerase [Pyrinomonadaceae bacterium]
MYDFQKLAIDGLLLVQLSAKHDDRGFFVEWFRRSEFTRAAGPMTFVQDNYSRSNPGVLRGLHYQYSPAQGKLVGVTRGKIWDVAVDLRPQSKTFGESFGCELSDDNSKLLWIPPGFGHGFVVTGSSPADVLYKTTAEYNPEGEGGIVWNDPELAIKWPLRDAKLSQRDKELPTFATYRQHPPNW